MEGTNLEQPIAAGQRKRTARACDACYRRKIKCDSVLPRCNWCAHNNSPCTYERRVVRKKASSKDDRAQLLGRVDRLEKLLASTLERGIRPSSPRSEAAERGDSSASICTTPDKSDGDPLNSEIARSVTERPVAGNLHFAGCRLGTINSSSGLPVFSDQGQDWIRSRTGENISLRRIGMLSRSWHTSTRSAWGVPMGMINTLLPTDMPDAQLVETYLSLYQHSIFSQVFPIIDPIRFRATITAAYSPLSIPPTHREHSARACVYAFLSFTSFFDVADGIDPIPNIDDYALKAHRILSFCYLDISVETLQASAMMALFHLFSGNLQYSLFQSSVSARMIFMLGAHTETYPSCTDTLVIFASPRYREQYLLRNIFWVTYMMDKELSLRTGQAPCLQDEHCDLTLPPPHVQEIHPHLTGYQPGSGYEALHLFPGDVALSLIKSKAYSALYSTRALQKTDAELLRDIRGLDDDLERWRLSIPLTHRPTLSFTRTTLPECASNMLAIMLHLDYCHCVAAIHQATSRCLAWNFGDHDEAEGVGTSLALSIEASRSSLAYLERVQSLIGNDSFWMVLYYPMSAMLTLFYSILHHPLELKSFEDLHLLSSVPSMIRRIAKRRLTGNETQQIQFIDELVEQLSNLGRNAIKKAKEDASTRPRLHGMLTSLA